MWVRDLWVQILVDRGGNQSPRDARRSETRTQGRRRLSLCSSMRQHQRDLFGADRLNVPYREIFGWSGGIAPSGVRKALRHEMRRLGLRHIDVADRAGVSRSHLENIMDGRRGASSLVASRLRDFLVDGAKTVGMAA